MTAALITARLEDLFAEEARRSARADLVRRWRQEGHFPDETVAHAAARSAADHPRARFTFAIDRGTISCTLADLWASARRVAGSFRERGIGPGDVVAVQLPTCPEATIAYLAASCAGAAVVPIGHGLGPAETEWILGRTGPSVYVAIGRWYDEDLAQRLDDVAALRRIGCRVVVNGEHASTTSTWAELASGPPIDPVPADPDGAFMVTYTSGTTGEPKGVIHSHNSFLAELRSMPTPPRDERRATSLQPWPAGHMGGMMGVLGPIAHGHDSVLIDRWDTERVVELLLAHEVQAMTSVPTVLLWLLDMLDERRTQVPLMELSCGGAGIPSALIPRGEARGWHIGRCYGSTEHPSATYVPADADASHRTSSDGRPMPGTHVRIAPVDGFNDGEGEVQLIGPEQCVGYTDPGLNDANFTQDGWLRTGDVGRVDEDGYLTITDRIKDLIIRGGENLSSVEIESILSRHPSVAEGAVVGVPDDRYGERVCAVVRLQPDTELSLEDVATHFETAAVERRKTPESLVIVSDFPRNASGKILKRELRQSIGGT